MFFLTVHLSIFISVINQLGEQTFCFTTSLFRSLYMLTLCSICYWNWTDRYYAKVNNKKLLRITKKIWTTYNFHNPKIRKITNLLKNTNIGIDYIYLTAVMNMVTLTTLWLFSSRSTHQPFCFHMNKCTSSRSIIIMNSSPNNFWTSIILCLTPFIQILHVITHLTPNPHPMYSNQSSLNLCAGRPPVG